MKWHCSRRHLVLILVLLWQQIHVVAVVDVSSSTAQSSSVKLKQKPSQTSRSSSSTTKITTMQTAKRQLGRLFAKTKTKTKKSNAHFSSTSSPCLDDNNGDMQRVERLSRVFASWSLLIAAKVLLLACPLFFRQLISLGGGLQQQLQQLHQASGSSSSSSNKNNNKRGGGSSSSKVQEDEIAAGAVLAAAASSAIGLIFGYGCSKIGAGLVQLVSELLLSPVTTACGEALPHEAFGSALFAASRRWEGEGEGEASAATTTTTANTGNADGVGARLTSGARAASAGQDEGKAGFARRALDRGLRASNQLLYRSIFNLLPALLESIAVLLLMFFKTSGKVCLTASLVLVSFVVCTGIAMQKRIPFMRQQLKAEGIANGFAEDALSLAETVAAFGASEMEIDRYAHALKKVSACAIRVRYSFSALRLMQTIILGLGSSAIAYVTWSTALASSSSSSSSSSISGQLVLVQALFAQLCHPLDRIGQHFRDCVSAAEDLRELEFLKASVPPSTTTMHTSSHSSSGRSSSSGCSSSSGDESASLELSRLVDDAHMKDDDDTPHLEFRNVTFAFAKANGSFTPPILSNVGFSIPRGGYAMAIVGPSGSGKSTCLRVLLGLETLSNNDNDNDKQQQQKQQGGEIFVNGVRITDVDRVPLFAMVGQESDLFRGLTLQNNVKYGLHSLLLSKHLRKLDAAARAEVEQEALLRAAADAQLGSLLERIDGGWDASVGARGRLLSGGERQRVCLARALFRQELGGGILLMDEVTASLDAKTEALVTSAIMKRVRQKGATAILIAHRLSSVRDCDLILVLRDGRVVERGTHQELMRVEGGWYKQSIGLQSASSSPSETAAIASNSDENDENEEAHVESQDEEKK